MVKLIGDVHGKYNPYERIIADTTDTIQLGDMGVGFRRINWHEGSGFNEYYPNPPHTKMKAGNHRFIRGNHDNPGVCKRHSQYIPDGTVEGDIMFIGGALSIDRAWRVKDYTWWEDEELSVQELNELVSKYMDIKPKIMLTHECPEILTNHLLENMAKINDPSRTRQAFNSMWEMHKPELWVFGHWHKSFDQVILGTRFICLNELETFDL